GHSDGGIADRAIPQRSSAQDVANVAETIDLGLVGLALFLQRAAHLYPPHAHIPRKRTSRTVTATMARVRTALRLLILSAAPGVAALLLFLPARASGGWWPAPGRVMRHEHASFAARRAG